METLFAVVDRHRKIRKRALRRGGTLMVYESQLAAQKQCRAGDSVVEVFVDFGKEPLFIRGEVLGDR